MVDSYIERNRGYLTASKMKLFIECPELYKLVYIDEVDTSGVKKIDGIENGKIIDEYLLTPEVFNSHYLINDKKMLKADYVAALTEMGAELTGKETVDQLKEIYCGNKEVLTESKAAMVRGIENEINRQPLWKWKPENCKYDYEHQVELVMDYKGIKLKGTVDRLLVDHDNKTIIIRDLKTTSQMYFNNFEEDTSFLTELTRRDPYNYYLQMYMYKFLCENLYQGYKVTDIIIDAIGTSDPYFYQAIKMDLVEVQDMRDTFDIIVDHIIKYEEAPEKFTTINREKLASNRYYKLDADSSVQKEFRLAKRTTAPEYGEGEVSLDYTNLL